MWFFEGLSPRNDIKRKENSLKREVSPLVSLDNTRLYHLIQKKSVKNIKILKIKTHIRTLNCKCKI